MRAISSDLRTQLENATDPTKVVTLALAIRGNYWTNHSREISYDGQTWTPRSFVVRRMLEKPILSTMDLSFDNVDDLHASLAQGDAVELYLWIIDPDGTVSQSFTVFEGQIMRRKWDAETLRVFCVPNVGLQRRATPRCETACMRQWGGPTCLYNGDRLPSGANPAACNKTVGDCRRMVGAPAITGAGLNDLAVAGDYEPDTYGGVVYYRITIATAGTPDTYDVDKGTDGSTFPTSVSTGTSVSTTPAVIDGAVVGSIPTIVWGTTTGHTAGDYWIIKVSNGDLFLGFRGMPEIGQQVTFGGRAFGVPGSPTSTAEWEANFMQEGYQTTLEPTLKPPPYTTAEPNTKPPEPYNQNDGYGGGK